MQYIPHRRYESHLSPCTKLQLHTLELPLSTVPKIQSAHTSTHTPPSHPSQIPNLLSLIAPPIHSPSFPAILISISRLSRRITVSSARNPSLSSLLTHIYTHTHAGDGECNGRRCRRAKIDIRVLLLLYTQEGERLECEARGLNVKKGESRAGVRFLFFRTRACISVFSFCKRRKKEKRREWLTTSLHFFFFFFGFHVGVYTEGGWMRVCVRGTPVMWI